MIRFIKKANKLIAEYTSSNPLHWIRSNFDLNESVIIHSVYSFTKEDLFIDGENLKDNDYFESDSIEFVIAVKENEFYKFKREILAIDIDLYIHTDIEIHDKMFRATKNIPIFKKINEIIHEDIYIQKSSKEEGLPFEEFERLIKNFPNSYELYKYSSARIGVVLRDYFEQSEDAVSKYEKYMNKKISYKGKNLLEYFKSVEKKKYVTILEKLKKMIVEQENYIEKQWQREIYQIILLLYSKYITVIEEGPVLDEYKGTTKFVDFMLVDSSGNIDIIEIKRPHKQNIVSKNQYRDNYIPLRELSGTIMQVEKYIFHLNKWGKRGEEKLTEKYKGRLPEGFKIKITNPRGIIIMGRENTLSTYQREDLEIIKRKYRNIIDIITYDELIFRLETLIRKFTL